LKSRPIALILQGIGEKRIRPGNPIIYQGAIHLARLTVMLAKNNISEHLAPES
jgi:hypothetical protein